MQGLICRSPGYLLHYTAMPDIVLTTLNARYHHASLGLRYLFANLNELQSQAGIREFVITDSIPEIAEKLLAESPRIIGIGVYIWNAEAVSRLLALLKSVSPRTLVVLGGPEVSYTPLRVDVSRADYIVSGEGELVFYQLCQSLLSNPEAILPAAQSPIVLNADHPVDLTRIQLPYAAYSDADIAHRTLYIEASRGCPFSCEFCLSSRDRTVRECDLDQVLASLAELWDRGARNFKFVDRTFNLKIDSAARILDFFLAKTPPYLVHFEVVPDHFPERLKSRLAKFPPAVLQLEIGIQTLNPEVAQRIHRPLKLDAIMANLDWLEHHTKAHLHVDLILGLPGETLDSFAHNLNTLSRLTQAEIQLGVLKKLSGTTLSRHDAEFGMVYNDQPPYDLVQNKLLAFSELQRLKRVARYWELLHNSGNFRQTVRRLWPDNDVYRGFSQFSDWLYATVQSTWQISLNRLAELLFTYLTVEKGQDQTEIADSLMADIAAVNGRSIPEFLRTHASHIPDLRKSVSVPGTGNKRQRKHTH